MVTKKPTVKNKPLKSGDYLPTKNVKRLPKKYFYLFNDFSDKTLEDWVKKKVCFGDKTLYKYISEYSRENIKKFRTCLLYTSPSPRDRQKSRMPSSA